MIDCGRKFIPLAYLQKLTKMLAYSNEELNDSKQLTAKRRYALREIIERDALAWALGIVTAEEIDRINILNASILAMHRALDSLAIRPDHIIVDGNRFKPYGTTPHATIVKGDAKFLSIAAASILAKTYRDDYMKEQHLLTPLVGISEQEVGSETGEYHLAALNLP